MAASGKRAGLASAALPLLAVLACTQRPASQQEDAAASKPPVPLVVLPSSSSSSSVSPSPPPSRATLLAADVSSRTASALSLLGPRTRTRVESDRFVLVDVDVGASRFDACVSLAHRALAVLFDGRLFELPDPGVTVWLFGTTTRFDELRKQRAPGPQDHPFGLYHRSSREILVNTATAGITTLTHELMHPILEADFPHAPLWLAEGMASLYELPDLDSDPGQIHGTQDVRILDLPSALRSPRLAPAVTLDALFATSDDAFRDPARELLSYAMAREALRWLDGSGQLWPFYRAWRDGILDDPKGEKAFAAVVHMTPAGATKPWLDWVRAQRRP